MTTIEKILLVVIGIFAVALVLWFIIPQKTKDEIAKLLGLKETTTTTTTTTTTPTTPPTPTHESIATDKSNYNVGEVIKWDASGLQVGKDYIVGVMKGNYVYWSPDRDKFTASYATASGNYYVGENVAGKGYFGIFDKSLSPLATKEITVSSTLQNLYPSLTWWSVI